MLFLQSPFVDDYLFSSLLYSLISLISICIQFTGRNYGFCCFVTTIFFVHLLDHKHVCYKTQLGYEKIVQYA